MRRELFVPVVWVVVVVEAACVFIPAVCGGDAADETSGLTKTTKARIPPTARRAAREIRDSLCMGSLGRAPIIIRSA